LLPTGSALEHHAVGAEMTARPTDARYWPRLCIDDAAWNDELGDGSRLTCPVLLLDGESLLHLVAYAVEWRCDCERSAEKPTTPHDGRCSRSLQLAASHDKEVVSSYDAFCSASSQQEPWEEVLIRGRSYVIFGFPGN
jgi:hypothetical protein